jgi:hypothetical protein
MAFAGIISKPKFLAFNTDSQGRLIQIVKVGWLVI